MSSKSKNGFVQFCYHQKRQDPSLSTLSLPQLVERCSPLWDSLTPGEKANFKRGNWGGAVYRALGGGNEPKEMTPAERQRVEQRRQDVMMKMIKETVSQAILDSSLEDKIFYVLSTNVFCMTNENGIVPAELSLAKFSLKSGVMETYQVLINPGNIPRGYLSDCMDISNKTHNIPLDYHGLCGDYNQILEDVLIFLMENEDNDEILPPLYGNPKHFWQDTLFLDWILNKANSSLMGDTKFQLFSLPALLYEMARMSPLGECEDRNRVPSLVFAEAQLERDTFMYMTETCELHGEGQPGRYYCCKAIVLGWSFSLFSLVCPLYSLPLLEVSHHPPGYSESRPRRRRVKSSFSFSNLPKCKPTSSNPSTTSGVFPGSKEGSDAAGRKPEGSGINQNIPPVSSSSYKQGTYSRSGSVASQEIFLRLTGMGRGVSYQGRVIPMGQFYREEKSRSTTLDLTSDKSYLSTEKSVM